MLYFLARLPVGADDGDGLDAEPVARDAGHREALARQLRRLLGLEARAHPLGVAQVREHRHARHRPELGVRQRRAAERERDRRALLRLGGVHLNLEALQRRHLCAEETKGGKVGACNLVSAAGAR